MSLQNTSKNPIVNDSKERQSPYRFTSIPIPKEPPRLQLKKSSLSDIIHRLPSYGTISYDPSTYYWYIKLPKEWQYATKQILNSVESTYNSSAWYRESKQLGKIWSNLVNVANVIKDNTLQSPIIDAVTPPSLVGLHISLGVWRIEDVKKPKSLVLNKEVEFNMGNLVSFRSIRPTPENIPGQYTNEHNLRYYPTRWLFVEVEFTNFEFEPRYAPHISIACVAVQLNVDHVARFHIEYKRHINTMDICAKCPNCAKCSNVNHRNKNVNTTTASSALSNINTTVPKTQYKYCNLSIKMSVFICLCTVLIFICYLYSLFL